MSDRRLILSLSETHGLANIFSILRVLKMTITQLAPEKLSFSTKLAYGAGDFGPAVTANILVFYFFVKLSTSVFTFKFLFLQIC